jgi:hypothetical protein
MRWAAAVVGLVGVAVGCGGSAGPTATLPDGAPAVDADSDGDVPPSDASTAEDGSSDERQLDPLDPLGTPTQFCRAFAAQYAVTNARCFGGSEFEWTVSLEAQCGGLAGFFATHTISYDRAAADECLAQLSADVATSCRLSVACYDDVIQGRLAAGQPCADSTQCAGGPNGRCEKTDITAACSPRVCALYPSVGEPCDYVCALGAECGADHLCHPVMGLGVGAPCDDVSQICSQNLSCRPDPSSSTGGRICRELGEGLPCLTDDDCPYEDACDTTCKPRLPPGSSCADWPTACFDLGMCDPTTKICVEVGHLGQACGRNGLCVEGSCELLFLSGCFAASGLGGFCLEDRDCAEGVCGGGTCVACP